MKCDCVENVTIADDEEIIATIEEVQLLAPVAPKQEAEEPDLLTLYNLAKI